MLDRSGDVPFSSGLSGSEKHTIVLLYVSIGMATMIGFSSLIVLGKVSFLLGSKPNLAILPIGVNPSRGRSRAGVAEGHHVRTQDAAS